MTDQPLPAAFAPALEWTRADLLDWLAALFAAPPTVEAVAAYRRGPAAALLSALAAQPEFADGAEAMREALAAPRDDAALAAALQRAFCLLFEGVGGPKTASPYESAHCSDGRLFQAPFAEMQTLLMAHGLSVSPVSGEPPDHISIELELTARLVAAGDADARAMAERLARWAPDFAAAVAVADVSPFWSGAAAVLGAAVARERAGFDDALTRS